jgi:two-component system sensor histidine kinase AlgZ
MEDTQILSVFQEPAAASPKPPPDVLLFDACHVGVVLRAVLFVETVVGVMAMFGSASPLQWLTQMSLVTGAAFPATLLWLIAACSLKKAARTVEPGCAKTGWCRCLVLSPVFMVVPCWC